MATSSSYSSRYSRRNPVGRFYTVPWLSKELCRSKPDTLFVFGDNLRGTGTGPASGQAVIRGEPNAFGIPTKHAPNTMLTSYFSNSDLAFVKPILDAKFKILRDHLLSGKDVAWPAANIGTDRADLENKAPLIWAYIQSLLQDLKMLARTDSPPEPGPGSAPGESGTGEAGSGGSTGGSAPPVINEFRGAYGFLSNFYPAQVTFDGEIYPSVEHAFQAAKTLEKAQRKPFQSPALTAAGAKAKGGPKGILKLRPDWDAVIGGTCLKVEIMRELLMSKFSDPELLAKLHATGNAQLIEGNTHGDKFWGVSGGEGQNVLGKLLMFVRTAAVAVPRSKPRSTSTERAESYLRSGSVAANENLAERSIALKMAIEEFKKTEGTSGTNEKIPVRKIISGGQTGADFGGLVAAKQLGLQTGGYAPVIPVKKGNITVDIPFATSMLEGADTLSEPLLGSMFGLELADKKGYVARTRKNAETADGTLWFGKKSSSGYAATKREVSGTGNAWTEIPWATGQAIPPVADFVNWLIENNIQTLNVAGNREGSVPGITSAVRAFLVKALTSTIVERARSTESVPSERRSESSHTLRPVNLAFTMQPGAEEMILSGEKTLTTRGHNSTDLDINESGVQVIKGRAVRVTYLGEFTLEDIIEKFGSFTAYARADAIQIPAEGYNFASGSTIPTPEDRKELYEAFQPKNQWVKNWILGNGTVHLYSLIPDKALFVNLPACKPNPDVKVLPISIRMLYAYVNAVFLYYSEDKAVVEELARDTTAEAVERAKSKIDHVAAYIGAKKKLAAATTPATAAAAQKVLDGAAKKIKNYIEEYGEPTFPEYAYKAELEKRAESAYARAARVVGPKWAKSLLNLRTNERIDTSDLPFDELFIEELAYGQPPPKFGIYSRLFGEVGTIKAARSVFGAHPVQRQTLEAPNLRDLLAAWQDSQAGSGAAPKYFVVRDAGTTPIIVILAGLETDIDGRSLYPVETKRREEYSDLLPILAAVRECLIKNARELRVRSYNEYDPNWMKVPELKKRFEEALPPPKVSKLALPPVNVCLMLPEPILVKKGATFVEITHQTAYQKYAVGYLKTKNIAAEVEVFQHPVAVDVSTMLERLGTGTFTGPESRIIEGKISSARNTMFEIEVRRTNLNADIQKLLKNPMRDERQVRILEGRLASLNIEYAKAEDLLERLTAQNQAETTRWLEERAQNEAIYAEAQRGQLADKPQGWLTLSREQVPDFYGDAYWIQQWPTRFIAVINSLFNNPVIDSDGVPVYPLRSEIQQKITNLGVDYANFRVISSKEAGEVLKKINSIERLAIPAKKKEDALYLNDLPFESRAEVLLLQNTHPGGSFVDAQIVPIVVKIDNRPEEYPAGKEVADSVLALYNKTMAGATKKPKGFIPAIRATVCLYNGTMVKSIKREAGLKLLKKEAISLGRGWYLGIPSAESDSTDPNFPAPRQAYAAGKGNIYEVAKRLLRVRAQPTKSGFRLEYSNTEPYLLNSLPDSRPHDPELMKQEGLIPDAKGIWWYKKGTPFYADAQKRAFRSSSKSDLERGSQAAAVGGLSYQSGSARRIGGEMSRSASGEVPGAARKGPVGIYVLANQVLTHETRTRAHKGPISDQETEMSKTIGSLHAIISNVWSKLIPIINEKRFEAQGDLDREDIDIEELPETVRPPVSFEDINIKDADPDTLDAYITEKALEVEALKALLDLLPNVEERRVVLMEGKLLRPYLEGIPDDLQNLPQGFRPVRPDGESKEDSEKMRPDDMFSPEVLSTLQSIENPRGSLRGSFRAPRPPRPPRPPRKVRY